MVTGKLKWFDVTKGFGFITADGEGGDVFVHVTALERANLPTVKVGDRLQFTIKTNNGKTFADDLSLLRRTMPSSQAHQGSGHAVDDFEREWSLKPL